MICGLVLLTSVTAGEATASSAKLTSVSAASSYEAFRQKHGHRGGDDHIAYEEREKLYHDRLAHVVAHNLHSDSWVAGVNKFADYTDSELKALLGYKRMAKSESGPTMPSFLQLDAHGGLMRHDKTEKDKHLHHEPADPAELAASVDWRQKLQSGQFIRDQGSCGSCWAVATVGSLEMQSEIKTGKTTELSFNQLVDCVPNPKHCGGTGGCEGATAELGFDYVKEHGLMGEDKYQGAGGSDLGIPGLSYLQNGERSCSGLHAKTAIKLHGWNRLPANEGAPLMKSLSNHGPVVVSVDGGAWMPYQSGVFDSCGKDSTVNHAVLAVGYGEENGKKYWHIRNSWGREWGDAGFIKIKRHDNDKDYCGTDYDPKQGVGCDGGPSTLPVCGMCGILSDSSHPVGAHIKN